MAGRQDATMVGVLLCVANVYTCNDREVQQAACIEAHHAGRIKALAGAELKVVKKIIKLMVSLALMGAAFDLVNFLTSFALWGRAWREMGSLAGFTQIAIALLTILYIISIFSRKKD